MRPSPAQKASTKSKVKRPGSAGAPSALSPGARKILERTRLARAALDADCEVTE